MKNSSEKKKSQTRSSIMKALNNNDTFGVNSISIMSASEPRYTNGPFGEGIYIDAWPEGYCSNGNPCWSQTDIENKFDRGTFISALDGKIIYTSRPENQFPERWNEMLIGNYGRYARFCECRSQAAPCCPR